MIGIPPICEQCKHLDKIDKYEKGWYCEAYPDGWGIPEEIIMGEVDHKKPFKGDNGIQFEQVNIKEFEESKIST
jgi:hypothetical protein|tara:strand:+ start:2757 stop:2978 length:222 start_codon:yes stop_codon:yes gene_type:complete